MTKKWQNIKKWWKSVLVKNKHASKRSKKMKNVQKKTLKVDKITKTKTIKPHFVKWHQQKKTQAQNKKFYTKKKTTKIDSTHSKIVIKITIKMRLMNWHKYFRLQLGVRVLSGLLCCVRFIKYHKARLQAVSIFKRCDKSNTIFHVAR